MKDLLINAGILSEHNTGLGVYTIQVIEHVCPILENEGIEFEIMCSQKEYVPERFRQYVKEVKFGNFIARNINTSREYRKKYKLVWSTTHHGGLFSSTDQIITIHDITPIIYPNGRIHQEIYYKYILPIIIKDSKGILTVSQNTKKDILKKYSRYIESEDKVKVIYESIMDKHTTDRIEQSLLEKYQVKEKEYFSVVGIHYEYKNLQLIIDAYAKESELRKYKVIIIGNDNNEYGKYLHTNISQLHLEDSFVFTGFVSNEEKQALVTYSIATIYPSKYEGFGLPVLEAMNMGVPVLSSNASSLPEVGGNAALYFSPNNVDELIKQILNITQNADVRNELVSRGYANVQRFDWNKICMEIYQYLKEIMGK